MKTKSATDGTLFTWINHIRTVQALINSRVISVSSELMDLELSIRTLVNKQRELGDNWLWCESDIEKDEGTYTLPSVDICSYFGLDNHHKLPDFFKRNGFKGKVNWDVESSCWWPRFATRQDAKDAIKFVNEMFDKTYISKK